MVVNVRVARAGVLRMGEAQDGHQHEGTRSQGGRQVGQACTGGWVCPCRYGHAIGVFSHCRTFPSVVVRPGMGGCKLPVWPLGLLPNEYFSGMNGLWPQETMTLKYP